MIEPANGHQRRSHNQPLPKRPLQTLGLVPSHKIGDIIQATSYAVGPWLMLGFTCLRDVINIVRRRTFFHDCSGLSYSTAWHLFWHVNWKPKAVNQ